MFRCFPASRTLHKKRWALGFVFVMFPLSAWAVLPPVILVPLAGVTADVAVIGSLAMSIYVIVRTYRYIREAGVSGRRKY